MMGPATRSSASVEAFCVLKRGSSDTLYLSHMSAASNRAGDGTGHAASSISWHGAKYQEQTSHIQDPKCSYSRIEITHSMSPPKNHHVSTFGMWKTLHGAQHGLMEFSWENLRGFWFGRRTVLAMNQSSGVTGRDRRRKGYMCISSFFVSIFRGSPRTEQQLLQASPCPEQQHSPTPLILLQTQGNVCTNPTSLCLPLGRDKQRTPVLRTSLQSLSSVP